MVREKKPVEPKEIIPLDQLDDYAEDFGELRKLYDVLGKYYVVFTFFKKDGSLRKAIGTRQSNKLKEVNAPIPFGGSVNSLAFYDLEDLHWKSISYNRYNKPRVRIIDMYDNIEELIDFCADEYNLTNLKTELGID